MEIVSAIALISINETFFIQLISFLVFLFLLNRLMIRPLISTMEQRRERLSDVSVEIETAKSNLAKIHRDLDDQRMQVLTEANAVVHQIDSEADRRATELIGASQSQIAQLRRETETTIKQQLKEARAQLAGEVDAITTTIMEKVLHRRLQS
ncbi:MAG: ATP synthase F0 subunit B [Desulfosarcina sp.]